MKTPTIVLFLLFLVYETGFSQGVGVGITTPHASSKLDVSSTTQGLLMPRMTTSQRKSISGPAAGLMVYDIDKQTIYLYDGVKWNPMLFTTNEGKLPLFPGQASDGMVNYGFGKSLSIQGDYAVIGSPEKDISGNVDQGGAYIFLRSNGLWSQQAILTASDGAYGDYFGGAVDMGPNGESVIIGSPVATVNGNALQGCAYIFVRNGTTWTQQAKLTASDGATFDQFGNSVSLDGDYAVIGATGDDGNKGSAYTFYKGSGWYDNQPHQAKLLASNGSPGDTFGKDVSLSGDYVVIGAPNYYYLGQSAGAGYIFNRNGTSWLEQAFLRGTVAYYFGSSVSMDGDYVAISAPGANSSKGLVVVYFKNTGWTNFHPSQATLSASDAANSDSFGFDVSLSGDYIIAGSPEHDFTLPGSGASYLFKRTGTVWSFIRKSDDDTKQVNEKFGWSVAINGFNMVVGIPNKNGSKGEVQFGNIE